MEPLALQTGTYYSQALEREQPYAWLAPADSAEGIVAAQSYPLLVMLHGHDGSYLDWPTRTRIARYAAAYALILVFPDGGNGWYTNAADGSARCEDDLIQDCLQTLQEKLPLQPPGRGWGIGGLSMGGYGAVKLALKHPHLFSVGFSHSGAFEKPMAPEPHP